MLKKRGLGILVGVGMIVMAATVFGQTNLTVVRHSDSTIWAMTCEGNGTCSPWTQIPGGFSAPPMLTWDPAISKYVLMGIGNNQTSVWRSTFNADGTWNNDWTKITDGSSAAVAGGGFVGPRKSPMELALLKWYDVNKVVTIAVDSFPIGLAFDGANIWVANYGSSNVTKINAATGALVGTYAAGSSPFALAFDGANIWVTNNVTSGTVTKINAATGALVGTYSAGNGPNGVAFDGANIWMSNYGSNNVTKLNAVTGAVVGTYGAGTFPVGLVFDGANIWVANYDSNNVTKLNAATGALVGTYAAGSAPLGLAFDGVNIWVVNNVSSGTVTKLNAATGALVGTYPVESWPQIVAFDGANIWVSNTGSGTVSKR